MYSKNESEVLAKALSYIVGEPYFPAGKGGESYNIIKLESKLIPRWGWDLTNFSWSDVKAAEKRDPKDKKYIIGKNWDVEVSLEGKSKDVKTTQIDKVLKQLEIKLDLRVLFQQ